MAKLTSKFVASLLTVDKPFRVDYLVEKLASVGVNKTTEQCRMALTNFKARGDLTSYSRGLFIMTKENQRKMLETERYVKPKKKEKCVCANIEKLVFSSAWV